MPTIRIVTELHLSVVYRITAAVRTSSSLSLLPPQLVHMSEATQIPPSYNDTLTLLVDGRVSALE